MQWWYDYFRDVDSLGPAFPDWLADDVDLQINDLPLVEGKPQVLAFFGDMLSCVKGLYHEHRSLLCNEQEGAGVSIVTYTLMDGTTVSFRCVSMMRRENGKVRNLQIYGDMSKIFDRFDAHKCKEKISF